MLLTFLSDKFHWLALLNTPSRHKKTLSFVLWICVWLLAHLANVRGISFLSGLGSLFICISGSPFGRKHRYKIILANNSDSPRWGGLDFDVDAGEGSGSLWLRYHPIPSPAKPCLAFHPFMTLLPKSILEHSSLNNFLNWSLPAYSQQLISLSFCPFNTKTTFTPFVTKSCCHLSPGIADFDSFPWKSWACWLLVLLQFSSDSCCCSFSSVKSSAIESLRCSFF